MIFFVILLGIIVLSGVHIRSEKSEILSRKDTTIINGIFVVLIFISHSTQYWQIENNIFDQIYWHVQNIHNQWIVTTFLAFSEYGVMEGIIKRGRVYARSLWYKRILKTLLNFDIAVLLYLIVAFFVNETYSWNTILWSLVGVTSVGNSNWYIFAILCMYLSSYVAAMITSDYKKQLFLVSVFACIYFSTLVYLGFPSRFYCTIMCYPFGTFLSIYKDKILKLIKEREWIVGIICVLLIGATYKFRANDIIMNISSIEFVLFIVWFLYFFEIKNNVLYFLGQHGFSIFILQRIPAILITRHISFEGGYKYPIILIDFVITIIISVLFDLVLDKVDKRFVAMIEGIRKS